MKALSLIPKKIKEMYNIEREKDGIKVHCPAFVNIDFDKNFKVFQDESSIVIKNSKCVVSLWKKQFIQHITIYKS